MERRELGIRQRSIEHVFCVDTGSIWRVLGSQVLVLGVVEHEVGEIVIKLPEQHGFSNGCQSFLPDAVRPDPQLLCIREPKDREFQRSLPAQKSRVKARIFPRTQAERRVGLPIRIERVT